MEEGGRKGERRNVCYVITGRGRGGGRTFQGPTNAVVDFAHFLPEEAGQPAADRQDGAIVLSSWKIATERFLGREMGEWRSADLAPGFNVRNRRRRAVVTDFAYLLAAAPLGAFDIGRFNDMLLRSMRAFSFRHAGPGTGRTTKSIMSNDRDNKTTRAIFPRQTGMPFESFSGTKNVLRGTKRRGRKTNLIET